jgi:hypothetical protein
VNLQFRILTISNWTILGCALLLYLVPFTLGYGWNAYHPRTPQLTGQLYQPSRPASGEISIESFGTGVIEVGLSARIAEFIRHGDLPFWNPYQGLGQPFGAMGEGNPYWPPRVVRALLPYSLENVVALILIPLSALAMYGLLCLLNASPTASIIGASIWATGGSLSMHIGRPSLFDQVAMLPVLFCGLAFAMKRQSYTAIGIGALAAACFAISGFPQIAVIGMVASSVFVISQRFNNSEVSERQVKPIVAGMFGLALGGALAAFYLVPLLGTVLTAWEPRNADHGFLPMPAVNLASFFFPILAGQPLNNWMPGNYPEVSDWNNLYGHSSNLVMILICFGIAASAEMPRDKRVAFYCFFGCGLALYLKYISLPPFSLFNYIPLIGTITPKHVNGVTAFMFTTAAALSIDFLKKQNLKFSVISVLVLFFGALVLLAHSLYLVRAQGHYNWPLAFTSVGFTLVILLGTMGLITLVAQHENLNGLRIRWTLLAAVFAEGIAYLLLGNSSVPFLAGRIAIAVVAMLAGALTITNFTRVASGLAIAAIAGYVLLIAVPNYGLPVRADLRRQEPYMTFLKGKDVDQYRTFGINADFSSIGDLDDISTAGPFAPHSFRSFVHLVSNDEMSNFYDSAAKFWLDRSPTSAPDFKLDQYQKMRPLFDWVGVKYLVLANKDFTLERRPDYTFLTTGIDALPKVYEDSRVKIFESDSAKSKAEFYTSIKSYETAEDLTNTLRSTPSLITKWAFISNSRLSDQDNGYPFNVPLLDDEPNQLQLQVDATMAGVLVIKNAFSPGWTATINGNSAEIMAVSGILQGIYLPKAGRYDVELVYRPPGFLLGSTISIGAFIILVGLLAMGFQKIPGKASRDKRT